MSTESIVSFASLILADAGAEITAESILNVIKAAGATVDGAWADIYAKALEGKDVKEILAGFNTIGASAAPAAGAAASGSTEAAAEEAEEEEAEESDDDMGFGLFD
ncbi:60S acidic ribosomal protein P1-beta [Hanseniaspora valbyensis]